MSVNTNGPRLHAGAGINLDGQFAAITPAALGLIDLRSAPISPLSQTATASSPTVAQFLNAANTEYVLGGTPSGMHAFTFLGVPVSYTDVLDGVSAQVWVTAQNQIIIAYQGTTGGENLAVDPVIALTQIIADVGIWAGGTPPAEPDSLGFANTVIGLAKLEGYSTSNIFVTGHSLGGIEAEYVAQHTGLGGIAFESTGLPVDKSAGSGSNFVNIITYGDPVGNYSSDIKGEQPFAPTYVAGGGSLPHYGSIIEVGNASDQASLTTASSAWGSSLAGDASTLVNLLNLVEDFHLPGTQAHDLGVTLNPYAAIVDAGGVQNSAVFNVAGDTISQLLGAAGGHLLPGVTHGHFA